MNLYQYVGGNATNRIDALGLKRDWKKVELDIKISIYYAYGTELMEGSTKNAEALVKKHVKKANKIFKKCCIEFILNPLRFQGVKILRF